MTIVVSGIPTLFLPLYHLFTYAASQHLFLHSSIFPSVQASQGDSPQRHLFLSLPLSVTSALSTPIVQSITGFWSVSPLKWASVWDHSGWPSPHLCLPSSHPPTRSLPPAATAPINRLAQIKWRQLPCQLYHPLVSSTSTAIHFTLISLSLHVSTLLKWHSLNMGVSTPSSTHTCTHTTRLLPSVQ